MGLNLSKRPLVPIYMDIPRNMFFTRHQLHYFSVRKGVFLVVVMMTRHKSIVIVSPVHFYLKNCRTSYAPFLLDIALDGIRSSV